MSLVLAALLCVIGPKAESLPTLTGQAGSYHVEQLGHRVTFTGDVWCGVGEIRGDKVRIVWIQHSPHGDAYAVGIYTREGRTLTGHYGYVGNIEICGWEIIGECLHQETIRIAE